MAKAKEEVIRLEKIDPKTMVVTIEGDGELVCNKMNDVTVKNLTDQRNDKAKKVTEKANKWEEIITAIHWKNGKPEEFSEESLREQLDPSVNQPCFTAFGFGKMLGQAVVRYGYDTYATKFNAAVNIVADGGLIPFTFTEYHLDEKLMSPKKDPRSSQDSVDSVDGEQKSKSTLLIPSILLNRSSTSSTWQDSDWESVLEEHPAMVVSM